MTIATASGATEGTIVRSDAAQLVVSAGTTWSGASLMRLDAESHANWTDVLRSVGESSLGFLADEPELYSDDDGEPV